MNRRFGGRLLSRREVGKGGYGGPLEPGEATGTRSRDRACADEDGVTRSINAKIRVRSMGVTGPMETRGVGEDTDAADRRFKENSPVGWASPAGKGKVPSRIASSSLRRRDQKKSLTQGPIFDILNSYR